MSKTTRFTKASVGGPNKGDRTLNGISMVPGIQRSVGISALTGGQRIAVVPADGADVTQFLFRVTTAVTGSGASNNVRVGVSANTSAFGTIALSAAKDYSFLRPSGASATAWDNLVEGTHIVVSAATVTSGAGTATYRVYTYFFQDPTDS